MAPDVSDLNEPNDPEWEAEQRDQADILSAADSWFDLCIRRSDPCDPAFRGEDPDDHTD